MGKQDTARERSLYKIGHHIFSRHYPIPPLFLLRIPRAGCPSPRVTQWRFRRRPACPGSHLKHSSWPHLSPSMPDSMPVSSDCIRPANVDALRMRLFGRVLLRYKVTSLVVENQSQKKSSRIILRSKHLHSAPPLPFLELLLY